MRTIRSVLSQNYHTHGIPTRKSRPLQGFSTAPLENVEEDPWRNKHISLAFKVLDSPSLTPLLWNTSKGKPITRLVKSHGVH